MRKIQIHGKKDRKGGHEEVIICTTNLITQTFIDVFIGQNSLYQVPTPNDLYAQ